MLIRILYFSVAMAFVAANAQAQQQTITPTAPPTAADSAFLRARQLVANGSGAAGRALVDSMITVTTPDTPEYAEALYWRAVLASTSADAEQDFRRIAVEYPLSPRASDALLRLSQLEMARGDKVSAATHLDRFLLENPTDAEASHAGLQLLRLEFEQGDAKRGCTILARTLRGVPTSDVELRNQISYYSPRCAGVDTTHVPPPATKAAAADSNAKSNAKSSAKSKAKAKPKPKRAAAQKDTVVAATPTKGRYTLQVAAYSGRASADRLAKRLQDLGLDSRVVPFADGFRVRVGRYATRTAAAAAAKQLKAKDLEPRIIEAGADDPP